MRGYEGYMTRTQKASRPFMMRSKPVAQCMAFPGCHQNRSRRKTIPYYAHIQTRAAQRLQQTIIGHAWRGKCECSDIIDLGTVIIDTFAAERLDPPKRIIGTDAYMAGMHLMLTNDFLFMTTPGLIGRQYGQSRGLLGVLDIDRPTVRRHAHLLYSAERPMSPAAAVLLQGVRDACEELVP